MFNIFLTIEGIFLLWNMSIHTFLQYRFPAARLCLHCFVGLEILASKSANAIRRKKWAFYSLFLYRLYFWWRGLFAITLFLKRNFHLMFHLKMVLQNRFKTIWYFYWESPALAWSLWILSASHCEDIRSAIYLILFLRWLENIRSWWKGWQDTGKPRGSYSGSCKSKMEFLIIWSPYHLMQIGLPAIYVWAICN